MIARRQLALFAFATTLVPAMPAIGQERAGVAGESEGRSETTQDSGLEDIVVIARRRDESLQNVPVAITALSADALRQANITRIENLATNVPSLVITPTSGRANAPGFAIRGQRQDLSALTNDPSVGVYFAEAVQARAFGLGQSLYDLQSVQVLKGPQGTLFGRNTTGGAILFQPNRPVLGVVEGYGMVRFGNYDHLQIQGVINAPLGEYAAIRLGYNRTRTDGYVRNVQTGERLNAERSDSYRASLLLRPASVDLTNILYIDYFDADQPGTASRLTAVRPGSGAGQRGLQAILDRQNATLDFYEVEGGAPVRSSATNLGITNVTEIGLGDNLTLKNIANYRRITSREQQNLGGAPVSTTDPDDRQRGRQFAEELQLQGHSFNERVNWIAGLYYFHETGDRDTQTRTFGALSRRIAEAANESVSVFGQADFKISESLSITAGGRYTWDTREFEVRNVNPATLACTFCGSATANFRAFTYTLGANWQIDADRLLYLAHRRGYRSGGFNSSATNAAQLVPFEPETVSDFEIGFKADFNLGDARLRTNMAAYHTDYTNVQRSVLGVANGIATPSIFNAAAANVNGFEFETTFLPVRQLELLGSVTYTRPKYTSFTAIDAATNLPFDASANEFAYIPRWTYRLGARWTVPLPEQLGELVIAGDYYWQDDIQFSEFNTPRAEQGSYGLLNGRIEFNNISGTGASAALFGRNLTGERYFAGAGDLYASIGTTYKTIGAPRTYGIELSYRF